MSRVASTIAGNLTVPETVINDLKGSTRIDFYDQAKGIGEIIN